MNEPQSTISFGSKVVVAVVLCAALAVAAFIAYRYNAMRDSDQEARLVRIVPSMSSGCPPHAPVRAMITNTHASRTLQFVEQAFSVVRQGHSSRVGTVQIRSDRILRPHQSWTGCFAADRLPRTPGPFEFQPLGRIRATFRD